MKLLGEVKEGVHLFMETSRGLASTVRVQQLCRWSRLHYDRLEDREKGVSQSPDPQANYTAPIVKDLAMDTVPVVGALTNVYVVVVLTIM